MQGLLLNAGTRECQPPGIGVINSSACRTNTLFYIHNAAWTCCINPGLDPLLQTLQCRSSLPIQYTPMVNTLWSSVRATRMSNTACRLINQTTKNRVTWWNHQNYDVTSKQFIWYYVNLHTSLKYVQKSCMVGDFSKQKCTCNFVRFTEVTSPSVRLLLSSL